MCIGSINSPYANTASAVYYALKFFLNPDAPANRECTTDQVDVPDGTWLNPRWPAPTIACTTLASSKICAVIWLALAKAIPSRILAPHLQRMQLACGRVTDKQETGIHYVFSDLPAGGWGGTPTHDGIM